MKYNHFLIKLFHIHAVLAAASAVLLSLLRLCISQISAAHGVLRQLVGPLLPLCCTNKTKLAQSPERRSVASRVARNGGQYGQPRPRHSGSCRHRERARDRAVSRLDAHVQIVIGDVVCGLVRRHRAARVIRVARLGWKRGRRQGEKGENGRVKLQ